MERMEEGARGEAGARGAQTALPRCSDNSVAAREARWSTEESATPRQLARVSLSERKPQADRRDESPRHLAGRSSRSSDRRRGVATTLPLDKWVPPQAHLSQGKRLRRAGGEIKVLSPMVAYGRRFK